MSLYNLIFYFFEAVAAITSISLVFVRNVFYAALLLIACLLSVAGLYVLSFAEFVAVTQIMVYAGGVLVLIIFGIMLTARLGEKPLQVEHSNLFPAIVITLALFILLCFFLRSAHFFKAQILNPKFGINSIETIGINLMTVYMVPFEIAAILLLVALIGAAIVASHKSKEV
jgi:NADH:ubiquinone oxidoreductase subunit 6 (subunit J)